MDEKPPPNPDRKPVPAASERGMKKGHRMEARAPEPDDLTSDEPVTPSAVQEQSGKTPARDVSAPHIPPLEE